jgi:regulator of RNase E activity RraA
VHASILRALGCVGAVTNGAVRDLPAVEQMGFSFFAAALSVSHSYVHIVETGVPVEVEGLKVAPGDLLHGDVHGVQSVPREIVAELPAVAARIKEREQRLIAIARKPGVTMGELRSAIANERRS